MPAKMVHSILVLVLLIPLLCIPVQARTAGETVMYSAAAITDEKILSNRLKQQINEYKGGELPFVGEAVFGEDVNAFVKRRKFLGLHSTTEEYYVTAARASKSVHYFMQDGDCGVTRLDAENYAGYNDVGINEAYVRYRPQAA